TSPPRLREIEGRGYDYPALRDAEPEEEVDQERLPRSQRRATREREGEGGDARHDEQHEPWQKLTSGGGAHGPARRWRSRTYSTSCQRSSGDIASPYAGITMLPLRMVA